MTGTSSPCGACKFLRRKCVGGCVFAPYFSHEQGATHFAAIHKVFGASNVSKLLAHLPVADRCEAAVTISYEAQARLQDPIYGCVSHIFALQRQVVDLQAQLASLTEQAAQNIITNPNDGKLPYSQLQDVQSWFGHDNSSMEMTSNFNPNCNNQNTNFYYENGFSDQNSLGNYHDNSTVSPGEEQVSFTTFGEAPHSMSCLDMQTNKWGFQDFDDFRYA
ncbi:hypothetical protein V6N13_045223 [Hibiscus sabdariffa]